MAVGVIDFLQTVHVNHKEQHPPAGSPSKFHLALCHGHETAPVIQAGELVREGEIPQLRLQHILLRSAPDGAHQEFADLLTLGVAEHRTVRFCAHISKQTGEFAVCLCKEIPESVINRAILSAGYRSWDSASK